MQRAPGGVRCIPAILDRNAANVLNGLGGDDTLDAAEAGDPNDVGNDRVDGGTGSDTCQTDDGDTARNCP
jgi:hypothetical protein